VRAAKDLVIKEAAAGDLNTDTFRQALLEFRNTPRACGKSPAEMLFGHQLRSIVPAHWSAFDPLWQGVIKAHDRQLEIDAAIKARYDESARTLPALHVGTKVRIQDHATKLWSRVGEIMSVGTKAGRPRSYRIKFANGSLLWRNRRHIKPMYAATSGEERRSGATARDQTNNGCADLSPESSLAPSSPVGPTSTEVASAHDRPRRSEGSKRIPTRFNDFVLTRQ
jgi:hypothetical protein